MHTPLLAIFFTNPAVALVTAAGAVSVPILIHLLNRKRYRVVSWAAMRFLLAAQKKNSRRMRIEQLLLLLIRIFLLLLIVLAMASVTSWAEEWWEKTLPDSGLLGRPGGRRVHRIIVVDGTLSMGAKQEGQSSAFEKARQQALRLVKMGKDSDAYSVLMLASRPKSIVGCGPKPSDDKDRIREALLDLRLTHGNGDVPGMLERVLALLKQSPSRFPEKEVYILTDLQAGSWQPMQSSQSAAVLKGINERAHTFIVDVGAAIPPPNICLTRLELSADRTVALTGQEVLFRAAAHNYQGDTSEIVEARVSFGRAGGKDGERFQFGDEITIGEQSKQLAGGLTNFSFAHKFTEPGDWAVKVRLRRVKEDRIVEDGLPEDDTRYLVLRVRDSVPVMVVNGKPAQELYDEATEYLFDALNPFEKEEGFAALKPTKKTLKEFADRGLSELSDYDCVFLCDVPSLTKDQVDRLEAHVLRGGGVVFSLGRFVDATKYNDMLVRDGKGLLPGKLGVRKSAEKDYHFQFQVRKQVDEWEGPLAAFKANEQFRKNLFEARFTDYVEVKPSSLPGYPAPRAILEFLKTPDKLDPARPGTGYVYEPALLDWQPPLPPEEKDEAAEERGRPRRQGVPASRGRVALFTSTVNGDWTDWPRKASFIWMMQELVPHVAASRLRGYTLTVGDVLEHYLPDSDSNAREVTLTLPRQIGDEKDRSDTLETARRGEALFWSYGDTDESGVYRAVVGANPREHLVAVNTPVSDEGQERDESDLTRLTIEDLRKGYAEWEFQDVRDVGDARKDGKKNLTGVARDQARAELGSTVAYWVLIAAFVLLLAESLLAWYFGHYSAVHERQTASDRWLTGRAAVTLNITLAVVVVVLAAFVVVTAGVLIHFLVTGDFLSFMPMEWRRGVESDHGIKDVNAGEDQKWFVKFSAYLWDEKADLWLAPILGLLVVALIVWLYRREGRVMTTASPRAHVSRLALLIGLRVGLVILFLMLLLPQDKVQFKRQTWPDIAILVDVSGSMAKVDDFKDPEVKKVARELADAVNLPEAHRLQLAQALLTRGDQGLLRQLILEKKVNIHIYTFYDRKNQLDLTVTDAPTADQAFDEIKKLSAPREHSRSNLWGSLRQVIGEFDDKSLAAVIILSDNASTEPFDKSKKETHPSNRIAGKVPTFFVGISDNHVEKDLTISHVECANTVLVNDNLIIKLKVTSRGYAGEADTVKVWMREKGSKVDLAQQIVNADANGKPVDVRLEYRPKTAGDKTFVFGTDVREDEVNKKNNEVERDVWVRKAEKIKILYVEGYGRWEYRALKTLLEREADRIKNEENKTMELWFWLQESDDNHAKQEKSALTNKDGIAVLPTLRKKEEAGEVKASRTRLDLDYYDVVLLGDIDPNPPGDKEKTRMNQFLKEVAELVRERGGGLVMIAGERFAPHAYKDSPLRDVLPIDIISDKPPEEPRDGLTESFRPELTAVGRNHPIFSFNEKDGDPVWNRLQEMFWHADGVQAKRAAEVLAVHPKKKNAGPGGKEQRLPLVVMQPVGKGRAMFLGFAETWRWRYREDEARFNQFWIQTARIMARARQGRTELRLDQDTPYEMGQAIKVKVTFPDVDRPQGQLPQEVRVTVDNKDANEQRTLVLSRLEGSPRVFMGTLTQTPPGRYEFRLTSPAETPTPRAETEVLPPQGEEQRTQMSDRDAEAVKEVWERTGGKAYTLANVDGLIKDLPSGERKTIDADGSPWLLWNESVVLIVLVTFLGVEWLLRKRHHLL